MVLVWHGPGPAVQGSKLRPHAVLRYGGGVPVRFQGIFPPAPAKPGRRCGHGRCPARHACGFLPGAGAARNPFAVPGHSGFHQSLRGPVRYRLGIMNSFRGLAQVQQATLATVAPGISEALIATAMGLFAAIPAVIAYNRFAAMSDALLKNYETFAEEFSSILHRRVHNNDQAAG